MNFFNKLDYNMVKMLEVIEKCRDLFEQGILRFKDGRIRMSKVLDINNGYIMVERSKDRRCNLHYRILFQRLGLLPYRCLSCWKNVIRPKTLKDTIEFAKRVETMDKPFKYGYDTREHTFGAYGIFIYSNSYEEAEENYFKLIELGIPEEIMWIQRGCTEMNIDFGDSLEWNLSEEEIEYQKWIESLFDEDDEPEQTELVKKDVFSRMVRWAYMIGDETYKEFVNDPLYNEVRKYKPER